MDAESDHHTKNLAYREYTGTTTLCVHFFRGWEFRGVIFHFRLSLDEKGMSLDAADTYRNPQINSDAGH